MSNLSSTTTSAGLVRAFQLFGQVTDAIILKDRNGHSTGSGVVTMNTKAEAQAAVKSLNGSQLDGRKITVKLA